MLAFAGAAVLTMPATMMPEAVHHGDKPADVVTTLGFALALAISAVR